MATILHNVNLNELSLVRSPANKGARVVLVKHDAGDQVAKQIAEEDGKFVVYNQDKSKSFGSYDSRGEAETRLAQIEAQKSLETDITALIEIESAESIAKLGDATKFTAEIAAAQADVRKSVLTILSDTAMSKGDKQALIEKSIGQFKDHITRLGEQTTEGNEAMTKEDQAKFDALTKSVGDLVTLTKSQATELAMLKMSDSHKSYMTLAKMDDAAQTAFIALDVAKRDEFVAANPVKKTAEPDPIVKSLTDTVAKLEKQVASLTGDSSKAVFAKTATDLGLPASMGDTLQKAFGKGDEDAQKAVLQLLKGALATADMSAIFKELGQQDIGKGGATAYEIMHAKAAELRKTDAGKTLTKEQAFAKVYEDPDNQELVKQHKAENRARLRVAA